MFSRELMGFALTLYAVILHTNILWIPVQFVYRYRFLERQTVYVAGLASRQLCTGLTTRLV